MDPIIIIINGQQVQLGSPLPTSIHSFSVQRTSPFPIEIDQQSALVIRQWLNNIRDILDTEYVTYNNTLIKVTDLNKV